MPSANKHAPTYRHVAWCYDALATAYSLGAIDRAKRPHHNLIHPGDKVLYVGAGRGREITEACQRGAIITCIEPCPAMAMRLHDRLAKHGERFTILPRPIQSVPADPTYDLVVAHFFLNIFNSTAMPSVLEHLCNFVKPGGSLVIADFKPNLTTSNRFTKLFRDTYYRPINLAGWLLRICDLHPIYDYAPLLEQHGLTVHRRADFHPMPGLPALYETLIAKKTTPILR